ncbi:hypothetical protein IDH18_02070 [Pelagibacterales bacterium SAG-MED41]|nr:hypothetical protein [Pelagibacterales bacterium SAG-MED41]|tara:strand:+ start:1095 stop:1604 length:510 start_codon:yes stop_codon:yes gene_type:complete
MDHSLEKKIDFKDKIVNFYNKNKLKILFLILILLSSVLFLLFIDFKKNNNNKIISEKYIQAGLYLESGDKEKAKNIYEDIILSKSKFYSILALNSIIEKNLETNEDKILNYFKTIENLNISKDKSDLIIFKKSLYIMKFSDYESGKKLLDKLIKKNSNLKAISEEIISK